MTLVGSLGDNGFKQLPNWRELAVQEVQSLNIPSAQYCNTLLEFVLNYGGGDDAPMICFMDAVAKEFGCNVNLGSQFWHALTYMSFSRKMKTYPLIRVALAVTNMTGAKVEDGVARLLGRSRKHYGLGPGSLEEAMNWGRRVRQRKQRDRAEGGRNVDPEGATSDEEEEEPL